MTFYGPELYDQDSAEAHGAPELADLDPVERMYDDGDDDARDAVTIDALLSGILGELQRVNETLAGLADALAKYEQTPILGRLFGPKPG